MKSEKSISILDFFCLRNHDLKMCVSFRIFPLLLTDTSIHHLRSHLQPDCVIRHKGVSERLVLSWTEWKELRLAQLMPHNSAEITL